MIRRPAVAGTFYDADPRRLESTIRGFLQPGSFRKTIGVIAPHAGYLYSGAVAGAVYSRVEPPDSCIILSPNHTGLGAEAAVMREGEWETPLGTMAIDAERASSLLEKGRPFQEDDTAHRNEHSIEVQLPFLQVLGVKRFVPITLMGVPFDACEEMGKGLAEVVRESDRSVLLIASSDMTHYESRVAAEVKDRTALERIEALDPAGLYEVVLQKRITMCGFIPVTIMLIAAKALGAKKAETVRYATSGDVTGDYDQVVGYAGVIVYSGDV
ncbi:MAG: AmmeMemoRadiSam system protein B [Deltaproteobacteria bacterium]|nr:AmmeMemoRadiSam system protein B [Deltaproteobacteria bacterium]